MPITTRSESRVACRRRASPVHPDIEGFACSNRDRGAPWIVGDEGEAVDLALESHVVE